jgi:thiol-disulfide isomerase/thioredoxin
MRRYICITVCSLFATLTVLANDSAYVRFTFTPPLAADNFYIILYDGIHEYNIDPQATPYWHGELFSSFGSVEFGYKIKDTLSIVKKAFFKKGNSEVHLTPSAIKNQYYAIDEKASKNLASYQTLGGAAFDSFTKAQQDAAFAFVLKHRMEIGRDAAITHEGESLFLSLTQRKVAFIRQFPDYYASFLTLSQLTKTSFLSADTLMELYDSVLPGAFKKSKAAEYLDSVLLNKVAVNSLGKFPDFSAQDMDGNKIESSALRGKYVLIQFWASWCSPCVREMPTIKYINDTYSGSNLTIISFDVEKDSSAFRRALEKHSMTWTQVFGDLRLFNLLGTFPVPQVFLIDPSGQTIYNRDKMMDPDLVLLEKILQERIGKPIVK